MSVITGAFSVGCGYPQDTESCAFGKDEAWQRQSSGQKNSRYPLQGGPQNQIKASHRNSHNGVEARIKLLGSVLSLGLRSGDRCDGEAPLNDLEHFILAEGATHEFHKIAAAD